MTRSAVGRAVLLVSVMTGVAGAGVAEAKAAAAPPAFLAGRDCVEHQGFVEGDDAAVAAAVPDRYTPVRDPGSGKPLVFVRALKCGENTLGDERLAATM